MTMLACCLTLFAVPALTDMTMTGTVAQTATQAPVASEAIRPFRVHSVKNVGVGNGAELATYVVEKGKPLITLGGNQIQARAFLPVVNRTEADTSQRSGRCVRRTIVDLETLRVRQEGAVCFASIAAPPMNLLGTELVRDLVSLIQRAEADGACHVLVFTSADPDYFIPHVDVTRISEYREQAAKLTGDASLGLLFRYLSKSRLVTIAQIEGRVRGAGSEFVLACDMRFASRESAIFSQPELGFGLIPGAGGIQHLTRLMGRARALEVMLSADDYDAELAERYGWINRALPTAELGEFVRSLAHRIAGFPTVGRAVLKDRVNAIAVAETNSFRRDSDLFLECARDPETQRRIGVAMTRGFQTHDGEMALGVMVSELADG